MNIFGVNWRRYFWLRSIFWYYECIIFFYIFAEECSQEWIWTPIWSLNDLNSLLHWRQCFIQKNSFVAAGRRRQIVALQSVKWAELSSQYRTFMKQPWEEWSPTFVVDCVFQWRRATCELWAAVWFVTDPVSLCTGTCVLAEHAPLQPGHTHRTQHIHPPQSPKHKLKANTSDRVMCSCCAAFTHRVKYTQTVTGASLVLKLPDSSKK